MNPFIAKKLGEVLAFSIVGVETLERGFEPLCSVLGEEVVAEMIEELTSHRQELESVAQSLKCFDTTSTKAAATSTKLRGMRDAYIGDDWDNPTEILEWLGFFEGAAIAHWRLVDGAADALAQKKLKKLTTIGLDFHANSMYEAVESLKQTGHDGVTAR